VEGEGCSIVRDFVGHGIGRKFHEAPQVKHYGKRGTGDRLKAGMTFTIEPMVNVGGWEVVVDQHDKWTVRTKDGSLSAQFEHTVLVTETGVEALTLGENEKPPF
jgi:methionyl aminopeptidase